MFPCISQVCSLGSSFEDDIDGYADAAGNAIELWLTKLEEYLKTHSPAEVRSRAADRGLVLAAAAFQGGLLVSQGEARRPASGPWNPRAVFSAHPPTPGISSLPHVFRPSSP